MKWPLRVPIDVQLSFFCSIQGIVCIVLGVLAIISDQPSRKFESLTYFCQLPFSISLLFFKTSQIPIRMKVVSMYTAMTMILGLVAAFAFMIFCNEFEIGKKTCKAHFGPAPYAESACVSSLEGYIWQIWRCGIYVVAQAICIHPGITVLIEWRGNEKNKEM